MGMIDIILIKATWCKGDVRIIEWCPFAWLGFAAHIRLPRSGNELFSRKKGEFSWYTIVWSSLEGHNSNEFVSRKKGVFLDTMVWSSLEGHNSLPMVYKWSHRRGITFSLNILLPDFYISNAFWTGDEVKISLILLSSVGCLFFLFPKTQPIWRKTTA